MFRYSATVTVCLLQTNLKNANYFHPKLKVSFVQLGSCKKKQYYQCLVI